MTTEDQDRIEMDRVLCRTMLVQMLDRMGGFHPVGVIQALMDIAIAVHLNEGGGSDDFHTLATKLMVENLYDSSTEIH